MLLSMTGFGKAVVELNDAKVSVEVKSLNSKQADISNRIPQICRELDLELRNRVARQLQRGKIDLSLSVVSQTHSAAQTLDIEALKNYKLQLEALAQALNLPQPADWYATLLRCPDAFHPNQDSALDPETAEAIWEALDIALDDITESRAREGAKLEEFFAERIARISGLLGEVDPYEHERVEKIRIRIEEGLAQLARVDVDRNRLEQEMIFYIEKLDVTEEKQRLAAHLAYFLETMAGEPGQGKKLGFIAQEMGREINTLGSKSNHAEMQQLVVKMKDELEQIKEQVLNVL